MFVAKSQTDYFEYVFKNGFTQIFMFDNYYVCTAIELHIVKQGNFYNNHCILFIFFSLW